MKILNILETAFRGTIEEQDDTVVWTVHAMKNSGADVHVLLRGNAVCHAVEAQDASGLAIGDWRQSNPPALGRDLQKFVEAGGRVYAVRDDIAERGLEGSDLVPGLTLVARSELAALCDRHDIVWHW